jgi:predicted RNase H-like HicB family nuclease
MVQRAAFVEEIPAAISQGEALEEARANLRRVAAVPGGFNF